MQSGSFKTIGTGELLAHLRGDLEKAERSVWVVCPWIDAFFADEVARCTDPSVEFRLAVRPQPTVEDRSWQGTAAGVGRLREHFKSPKVVCLERLHAKAIVADEQVVYVGSANFYRYSLEQSWELVVRGPASACGDLLERVGSLFREGTALEDIVPTCDGTGTQGIREEILDPIVANILERNPKAWIPGAKSKRPRSAKPRLR